MIEVLAFVIPLSIVAGIAALIDYIEDKRCI